MFINRAISVSSSPELWDQAELSIQNKLRDAIDAGETEQVLESLKNVNHINQPLSNGFLPLHYAIRMGKLELVKAILKEVNYDLQSKDTQGLSALDHAMIANDRKMIEWLLGQMIGRELHEVYPSNPITKLSFNVYESEVKNIKLLIEKFVSGQVATAHCSSLAEIQKQHTSHNVNAYDRFGLTPLHHAVLAGQLEAVHWLIEKGGADCKILTQSGQSLLHLASMKGHVELISYLIKAHSMNPNGFDRPGRTPLHYAMVLEDLSAAKTLIQNGGDPLKKLIDSFTLPSPLQVAFFMAMERSGERDPLSLTWSQWMMFGGILASWTAKLCGVNSDFANLSDLITTCGAFFYTANRLQHSSVGLWSYLGAITAPMGIQAGFEEKCSYKFTSPDWASGINCKGNTIPRLSLILDAGATAATCYQVTKSSLQGLSRAWKNRSREPLRGLRNMVVHSVIGTHAAHFAASRLPQLYESNQILNAWDQYMETEKASFSESSWAKKRTIQNRQQALIQNFWKKYQSGKSYYSSDRSVASLCSNKSEKECIMEGNNNPQLYSIFCEPGTDSCSFLDKANLRQFIPKRDVRARAAAILQLKEGYADQDVTASARQLQRRYHPDKCRDYSEEERDSLSSNIALAQKLLTN